LKKATYQEEIKYLVEHSARNKFIKNLALSLKNNTLVLFNYISHGETLYQQINNDNSGRKVFMVYGKTDAETREEIRHIVEKENDAIIVASYGVFSTGVNIKNLHNIIFASPSKSRIRNLQSIGRGLRKSETKTHAVLFDIADDIRYKAHKNYTLEHFEERIKLYGEEKFEFRIYKISLKG
jgi:superfamily II DNA or RNA helicase